MKKYRLICSANLHLNKVVILSYNLKTKPEATASGLCFGFPTWPRPIATLYLPFSSPNGAADGNVARVATRMRPTHGCKGYLPKHHASDAA